MTKSIQIATGRNPSDSREDNTRRSVKDLNLFEIEVGVTFNARQLAEHSEYFDPERGQSLVRAVESAQGNDLPNDNRQIHQDVNVYVEEGTELKPDPNIKVDPTYVINYKICKCGKHEAIHFKS